MLNDICTPRQSLQMDTTVPRGQTSRLVGNAVTLWVWPTKPQTTCHKPVHAMPDHTSFLSTLLKKKAPDLFSFCWAEREEGHGPLLINVILKSTEAFERWTSGKRWGEVSRERERVKTITGWHLKCVSSLRGGRSGVVLIFHVNESEKAELCYDNRMCANVHSKTHTCTHPHTHTFNHIYLVCPW